MMRLRAAALGLLVVASSAGSVHITMRTGVPAVWVANGIGACLLLRVQRRRWPYGVALLALATGIGNVLGGRPIAIGSAFGVANAAEILVIAALLRRGERGPISLVSWSDLRRLVVAASAGTVVFALFGVLINEQLGNGWTLALGLWSLGSHLSGSLVVTPLIAVRPPTLTRPARFEVAAQTLALAVGLALAFRSSIGSDMTFLLMPALLWAAARFPARLASWQLTAVAAIVVTLTMAGAGPFLRVRRVDDLHAVTTSVQTFLIISALVVLSFSISTAAERAAVSRYLRREAEMSRLIESAEGTAFIATDTRGVITLFSTGAEGLLGYRAQEVVGSATPALFHRADEVRDRAARFGIEPALDVVTAEIAQDLPWTYVCKDGSHRSVSIDPATVRDHWGQPIAYLAIVRDVTESLAAEQALLSALETERDVNQRLRELDEAKSDFVANVSHELRTPLAAIIGSTELLEDGLAGELSTDQRVLLERISRNGARLAGLIEDLLTLGEVSDGRFAVRVEPVDLREVVWQALDEHDVHAQQVSVQCEVPAAPLMVAGDSDQLVRLTGNLLGNALKFTPPSGRVRVAASQDGQEVRLEVSDSGIGIPEDEQAQVFDRFFRASGARGQEVPGTGLGLSIVRSIALAHGGSVECVSAPGHGSTFAVRLPSASIARAG